MRVGKKVLAAAALLPASLLVLAGCAAPEAQTAETRLECEIAGRTYVVSHPWTCLRDGGRVIEVSAAPSRWVSQRVKVRWQGRDEIQSGRMHYNRFGRKGEMRLELPEAGDSCRGTYRLHSFGDADWLAVCDSGQRIRGIVFLDEGGVSVSGHGKDAEGRTFGFYPQAVEG